MAKNPQSAAKAIKTQIAEMQAAIDAVRDRIARLKSERERIGDAPLPFDQAAADLKAKVAAMGAEYQGNWAIGRTGREPLEIRLIPPTPRDCIHDPNTVALAFFFGDLVSERLIGELRRRYAELEKSGISPMTATDREAALADFDAKIAAAEVEEEALVIEAQEAGIGVARREDVDPAVFLEVVR